MDTATGTADVPYAVRGWRHRHTQPPSGARVPTPLNDTLATDGGTTFRHRGPMLRVSAPQRTRRLPAALQVIPPMRFGRAFPPRPGECPLGRYKAHAASPNPLETYGRPPRHDRKPNAGHEYAKVNQQSNQTNIRKEKNLDHN